MEALRVGGWGPWLMLLLLLLCCGASGAAGAPPCPPSCRCLTTPEGLHKAACSSAQALHKYSLKEKLHNINILDLSHANITKLAGDLDRFTEVVSIDLSFNRIKHLDKVLRGSKKLVHLNLANNVMRTFSASAIPTSVSSLDLTNNLLIDVPRDLSELMDLEHLQFKGNLLDCSCKNIKALDALKTKGVIVDQVKCHSPIAKKGQTWTQVKIIEICSEKKLPNEEKLGKNILLDDMMLGDQPSDAENFIPETTDEKLMPMTALSDLDEGETWEGSGSVGEDEDKVFFRVSTENPEQASVTTESDVLHEEGSGDFDIIPKMNVNQLSEINANYVASNSSDEEGSGDFGSGVEARFNDFSNESVTTPDPYSDDVYDYEGSGEEVENVTTTTEPFITGFFNPFFISGHYDNKTTTSEPFEEPNMPSIFQGKVDWEAEPSDDPPTEKTEVIEEIITKKNHNVDAVGNVGSEKEDEPIKKEGLQEEVKSAGSKGKTSLGTYICIGILIAVVLLLILITIIKGQIRKKRDKRYLRQQKKDVEKAGKEMVDMNTSLLGKPVANDVEKKPNGKKYELVPTHDTHKIKENGNSDKRKSVDDNVLKSHVPDVAHRNGNKGNATPDDDKYYPHDERPTVTSVPLKSEPDGYMTNGNGLPERDYLLPPQEYVPVYPPDSGRVRIKLSEMPKPKTPVLITRSRSNAGDIIITPALDQSPSNKSVT